MICTIQNNTHKEIDGILDPIFFVSTLFIHKKKDTLKYFTTIFPQNCQI